MATVSRSASGTDSLTRTSPSGAETAERDEQVLEGVGLVEDVVEHGAHRRAGGKHRVRDDHGVLGPDLGQFHVVDRDRKLTVVGHPGLLVAAGGDDALLRAGNAFNSPSTNGVAARSTLMMTTSSSPFTRSPVVSWAASGRGRTLSPSHRR